MQPVLYGAAMWQALGVDPSTLSAQGRGGVSPAGPLQRGQGEEKQGLGVSGQHQALLLP